VWQHVEAGVKEGMRETGRERGETRGTSHRLTGGRGRAARRVVAGASIEIGVKMRESVLGKTTRCAEDEGGGKRVLIVVQSGAKTASGAPNPKRQRTAT
jgi:hypothetical protein